jgi:hypothetical protein
VTQRLIYRVRQTLAVRVMAVRSQDFADIVVMAASAAEFRDRKCDQLAQVLATAIGVYQSSLGGRYHPHHVVADPHTPEAQPLAHLAVSAYWARGGWTCLD